ncbi:uncharacterized protein LOC107044571 [Diachasma alloeum]|uniref:uncharacterized protein LOC107044571 n=1 Tax=Diachasma alloeum TaxID=454923 RepID=UPI0007382716|nr:uncharacterized protein LOC107044571 [Diachasma alloeum]
MASAGKLQPVKVAELLGHPKSAGKESVSERKKMEPVRIKQLLESTSKSCSRSTDRVTRPTFLIPGKGVRRKLYDRSPSPRTSRPSICPPKWTRPSTRASAIAPKNPSRMTLLPPSKARQSLLPPHPSKPSTKPRKSFLLPPNSIVKQHMEKSFHEKTILEASLIITEENPQDNPQETVRLERPTVIIRSQSSKKAQKPSEPPPEDLDATFSKDSDSPEDLEKSLENKENIPPPVEPSTQPLAESKSVKLDSELPQEILRRLEKIEVAIEEIRTTQNRKLQTVEQIYDFLKSLIEGKRENSKVLATLDRVLDKENLVSGSRSRRRSKASPGERRRSARIAERQSNDPDDSFSMLEEKLNVKSTGKSTKVVTPGKKTPVHDQFMRRRCKSERALREYLAMKASMSYLETPEAGKLREMQGVNTPSGKKSLRRSISRKVFDELEDLYSDDIE